MRSNVYDSSGVDTQPLRTFFAFCFGEPLLPIRASQKAGHLQGYHPELLGAMCKASLSASVRREPFQHGALVGAVGIQPDALDFYSAQLR